MAKSLAKTLLASALLVQAYTAQSQSYSESFNDITTLTGSGWFMQNNSSPVGSTGWFQGNPVSAGGPFDSYNGAANAYIGANYNNTGNSGTISNWLLTPNRTLRNGDVFTFYTRKPATPTGGTDYPDRLEVRLSTNGASTNVGSNAAAFGDFSTLLLSVNPTLISGGYPYVWTQYTITISGLPAPTSGRIGFRYFVTGAGLLGSASDYIGIDQVDYTPYVCPAFTLTAGGALTGGVAGSAYSTTLTQTGALGAPNFAITAGALPPGITLSASGTISGTPTATGTFNFTVTVNDASGCSGSQAYSITVVCPANPISFPPVSVCSNAGLLTLTNGSPAGGSYSGTGVSGGQFDPAAGTQSVSYDITDPYGCAHSQTTTITVNQAPTVTQSAIAAICSNVSPITLSGGAPAGGVYSGTGVSGGQFDPTAGSQTVTYTYTDGNNCSNSASTGITVNQAPTVTLAAISPVCSNSAPVALSGGAPAGGVYSGTGVAGSQFDPTFGTQTVTYTYTDANSCTNSASTGITVNTAPTVTQSAVADVCSNASPITLSGGSPAGGTYSGTGVSAGEFDPSAGTQTLTYTYTDANNCTESDDFTVTVNAAPVVTGAGVDVCSNASPITLSVGSPAGGTYSGTGVTAGEFDPTAGTQTVTYTYTDANGCTESDDFPVTVNSAPTVTATSSAVCSNAGSVVLSAGLPAGGTYSGTGVTAGEFNPTAGTQTVTYTYTDGNGCTDDATFTVTVNTAPTVTFTLPTTVCVYGATVALGGTPAGGTYTGTGVSNGQFNPATAGVGPHSITYTYTDGNGCSDNEQASITVSACAGIEENANEFSLNVYPNPSTGIYTLSFSGVNANTNLEVVNLQGKVVYKEQISAVDFHTVDLSAYASGVYYLRATSEGKTNVLKLIKQ